MNIETIVAYLNDNSTKKVSTILDELTTMLESIKLTTSARMGRTYLVGQDNKVYAIYCYYHKQWELLSEVEYGSKVSSSHGYNTMCKQGVREWTRQQKNLKLLGNEILSKLENGELLVEEIADYKTAREESIRAINAYEMPIGYENQEDVPVQ